MSAGLVTGTLRHEGRRFVATALAVVLGVGFVAAALVLGQSMSSSISMSMTGDLGTHSAVIVPGAEPRGQAAGSDSGSAGGGAEGDAGSRGPRGVPAGVVDAVRDLPEVGVVRGIRTTGFSVQGTQGFVVGTSRPAPSSLARLSSGRWPVRDGEIAVSERVASSLRLAPGSVIRPEIPRVADRSGTPSAAVAPPRLTVVGVVDAARDGRYAGGMPVAFLDEADLVSIAGSTAYEEIDVDGRAGTTPDEVRTAVARAAGPGVVVRTGAEQARIVMDSAGGAGGILIAVLLAFAAIALVVAALVIANTFAILLARRTRQTALLRCVGATRAQVVRQSVVESAVLGAVAAVAGTAFGVGISALLVHLAGSVQGVALRVTIPASALSVPLVAGVVVTVAAAVWPIVRASRVTPLAALVPVEAARPSRRAGLVRTGSGLGLGMIGGTLLVLGAAETSVLAGVAGGALSFLGIVLLLPVLVPRLLGALGSPARALGTPGELAVLGMRQHPGRAASTTGALLVGVTLVTMTLVGGATATRTITAAIDREYAVDVAVSAMAQPLPSNAGAAIAGVPGVVSVAPIPGAEVKVGGRTTLVMGMTERARAVSRNVTVLALVRPGVLVVPQAQPRAGLTQGARVTLAGPSGTRSLRVVVDDRMGYAAVATDADLRAVAPTTATWAVLARADSATPAESVLGRVDAITRPWGEVRVGGSLSQRSEMGGNLRTAMLVLGALLAVSVLIAVVGVGNTLSLGVIERTRESALVRALGMTRGQLRGMLAIEGVLLALGGTVLGIALGTAYGVAGTAAILGQAGQVVVSVPWLQLGLVAVGAALAGLLASLLPGRRAARTMPALALATD